MLSIFLFNGQLAIASIYHYIFMVCLGDPRLGLLLKIPVLLDLLEDGKVTMMATEEEVTGDGGWWEQFSSKCGVEASGIFSVTLEELWESNLELHWDWEAVAMGSLLQTPSPNTRIVWLGIPGCMASGSISPALPQILQTG